MTKSVEGEREMKRTGEKEATEKAIHSKGVLKLKGHLLTMDWLQY